MSLTQILKNIRNITEYFADLVPQKTFPPISNDILNPTPDWVDKYRVQPTFGTFTDYILRKIIKKQISAEIYDESQITAELSLLLLERLQDQYRVSERLREAAMFYLKNKSIVDIYKDPNIRWKDCLVEAWYLSHLDEYYRCGQLELPFVTEHEIKESYDFFSKLEKFIKERLCKIKRIFLNPTLGHNSTVKADADLILDNVLLDIKTVKDAKEAARKSYYQLLGYVTLFDWLKENESVEKYPVLKMEKIDFIGYLFPKQLNLVVMDIRRWTQEDRKKYLDKILEEKDRLMNGFFSI